MKKFYSPSARGFYDESFHGNRFVVGLSGELVQNPECSIPGDAVEVTDEVHAWLLAGQSAGKHISLSPGGMPTLVDPPPPSAEELAATERHWRDQELGSAIWLRDRHRDQQEIATNTTLTAEQFRELLVYMQALRDWPQAEQFPEIAYRPVAPPWLAELTE
ncbi:phage tail assembly chaperone [Pseudomonas carassii]|uniref:Phage tail assembly chaperone n=1 Tax=Pseudomonas carassii TaxID=3115855 RepID=A0ABU7HDW3_9PSED|nr:phage tail assembly chaperone [Pseudomonas sp. 137P]MEE1889505.1 phage tail assembly chaperone [Pseudomonas sp. 137P]